MNQILDLAGEWLFRLDKEKQGLTSHYEKQTFEDTIQLPTTVSEAHKGTPHDKTYTGYLTDPYEISGMPFQLVWVSGEVRCPPGTL